MLNRLAVYGALAITGLAATAIPAFAMPHSDRMAGSIPGAEKPESGLYNYEADESSEPPEAKVREVDFRKLEALGLLGSYKEGAIGKDVWHSMNRSDIMVGLIYAGPRIKSRTITRLTINTLLSKSDADLIVNDIEPEAGNDIFTLRLKKLLELGLFSNALDMYALQRSVPYHPELAEAGALAMLGTGGHSLACLEGKSFEKRFSDVEFWQDLNEFCRLTIEDGSKGPADIKALADDKILRQIAMNPNFRITYSDSSQFLDFTMLEVTALFASGRVDYSKVEGLRIHDIPERELGLMLLDKNLPENMQFPLAIEAVRRGIRSNAFLDTFYKEKDKEGSGKTAEFSAESIKSWKDLPALYKLTSKASGGGEQAALIRRALEITPSGKWPALLPFAQMIKDMKPDTGMSPKSMTKALTVMFYSDITPGKAWRQAITEMSESNNRGDAEAGTLLLMALDIMDNSGNLYNSLADNSDKLKDHQILLVEQVIKALDISSNNRVQTGMPYEKGSRLTFGKGYVMPSVILVDYLDQSYKNKLLGGGILFSAIALRDTEPADLFPGLVRQMVSGLNAVGQNIAARGIAVEAILGLLD